MPITKFGYILRLNGCLALPEGCFLVLVSSLLSPDVVGLKGINTQLQVPENLNEILWKNFTGNRTEHSHFINYGFSNIKRFQKNILILQRNISYMLEVFYTSSEVTNSH